jgi:alanine dehydrogenase
MQIGLLKETGQDQRVALMPDNVKELINLCVSVAVEQQAGEGNLNVDLNDAILKGTCLIHNGEMVYEKLHKINK